jgi:hypothetical protein
MNGYMIKIKILFVAAIAYQARRQVHGVCGECGPVKPASIKTFSSYFADNGYGK